MALTGPTTSGPTAAISTTIGPTVTGPTAIGPTDTGSATTGSATTRPGPATTGRHRLIPARRRPPAWLTPWHTVFRRRTTHDTAGAIRRDGLFENAADVAVQRLPLGVRGPAGITWAHAAEGPLSRRMHQ